MLGLGINSLLAGSLQLKPYIHLQWLPHLTRHRQVLIRNTRVGHTDTHPPSVVEAHHIATRVHELQRPLLGRACALQCLCHSRTRIRKLQVCGMTQYFRLRFLD